MRGKGVLTGTLIAAVGLAMAGVYSVLAGDQPDPKPPPENVVAAGLGMDKEHLVPVGGQWLPPEDLATKGQIVLVQPIAGDDPPPTLEPCWVIFNAPGTALQSVLWLDRRKRVGQSCDAAAATAIAQDLGKRLLGDWPPGLKL